MSEVLHGPLEERHRQLGASFAEFSGWLMPVSYAGTVSEHTATRTSVGLFDVSHLGKALVRGPGAAEYVNSALTNDLRRIGPGKAQYTLCCTDSGGVIDDLIACHLDDKWFRVVVNAGTADKDLAWIKEHAKQIGVAVVARRDLAIIAIQGPHARAKTMPVLPAADRAAAGALGVFFGAAFDDEWFVSRTGYTGEDGFEVALPSEAAADFWSALKGAGVAPCGLGARDTLRLEAGMNLYGSDMDETVTPLESGLAWTVAFGGSRDFVGRSALEKQLADGVARQLTGLLLEDRGVLRAHQKVFVGAAGEGEVTSGTFSPTLERSIALARLPAAAAGRVEVDIRGKRVPARIVNPPFARNGKVRIEL